MARPIGPKKVQRYSLEVKLKAVKLSQMPGVEVQAVAEALETHPFMLSRWRKEARGIIPVLARRSTPHCSGLGTYRWVVESTDAWIHRIVA